MLRKVININVPRRDDRFTIDPHFNVLKVTEKERSFPERCRKRSPSHNTPLFFFISVLIDIHVFPHVHTWGPPRDATGPRLIINSSGAGRKPPPRSREPGSVSIKAEEAVPRLSPAGPRWSPPPERSPGEVVFVFDGVSLRSCSDGVKSSAAAANEQVKLCGEERKSNEFHQYAVF
ncbi:Hypothetical protein SMAX5B_003133 [Scophthalmus maximus]|uniref:Uncharacterized protein n=1 Tax=Scophthalmus maximus TaxID=52904 RepID=A0A2U9CX21_SCOMX|nr:Hypothetical protein SMAX5B_003133 [Scophthalmus maximus]